VPQLHTTAAAVLFMSQTELAYSLEAVSKPAPTNWPTTNLPYTAPLCRLMVSTLVVHVITTHLPTKQGWKAEFSWLVDP